MSKVPVGWNICNWEREGECAVGVERKRREIERRRCGIFAIVCLQFWIGKMPLRWSLESVR